MSIQIKAFRKRYSHNVVEINDDFIKNRVTILYGENGTGKSTLLKAIAGLIKYDGEIKTEDTFSYLSEIDYIPKDILVIDFVDMILKMEAYKEEDKVILWNQLSLEETNEKNMNELSKGMLKKVYLFLCLMIKRDCYLLDEPFSGVDKESMNHMIRYIKTSTKRFVISTHHKELIEELKGDVVYL